MCADIPEVYTITKNSPEHGTVELSKTSAMVGETITVTANPDAHYQVSEIKVNDDTIDGTSFTMPASNVNVEVNFAEIRYSITKAATSHGEVTIAENAAYDDTVAITVTPDAGWRVFDIKVDNTHLEITENIDTATATFRMPTNDVNVSVVFVNNETTVEFYINNEGPLTSEGDLLL